MTRNASRSGPIGQFWTMMIEASAAAVAAHYDSPWQRQPAPAGLRRTARRSVLA